jgi:hypothetical protein
VVPHHTWSTGIVIHEEAHVPRVLVNHSPKDNGTLHLWAKLITQDAHPVVDGRLSELTWCHGGVGIVIHPDTIWKFTIHSTVNSASSVKSMLATNHGHTSHWLSTTLAWWSEGVNTCTNWMWFMENSPDIGSSNTFSSCKSLHWFWDLLPLFSTSRLLKN